MCWLRSSRHVGLIHGSFDFSRVWQCLKLYLATNESQMTLEMCDEMWQHKYCFLSYFMRAALLLSVSITVHLLYNYMYMLLCHCSPITTVCDTWGPDMLTYDRLLRWEQHARHFSFGRNRRCCWTLFPNSLLSSVGILTFIDPQVLDSVKHYGNKNTGKTPQPLNILNSKKYIL